MTDVFDCADPDDTSGMTYREVNMAKPHGIARGALVEYAENGVRGFVVHQYRDCDGTPLYALSLNAEDELGDAKFFPPGWSWGIPEESLRVVGANKGTP